MNQTESMMLTRLELATMTARLAPEDAEFIARYLAGEEEGPTGIWRLLRAGHRMARLLRLTKPCHACGMTREAEAFGWSGTGWPAGVCLTCEPRSGKERRRQLERWMADIDSGALLHCTTCDEQKGAAEFFPESRKRCRGCASHHNQATRRARSDTDAVAAA
jgi:hypothetical protein